jgi:hypothetical protein
MWNNPQRKKSNKEITMAESIYTQLKNQKITTPVNGIDYFHNLPDGLFPSDVQFENEEYLLEWANDNDYAFPLIQKGIQKAIIEVRAAFKSCKKDEVWTEKMGNDNIDEMVWKIVDRPNQGAGKAISEAKLNAGKSMAKAMYAAGIVHDMILTSLVPVYGEEVAEEIMESIA